MEPIVVTQLLDAPANKVWNALSLESELKKWYFNVHDYVFEAGKEFTFYESEETRLFLHKCKFLTIIPMQLIEYSWAHPSHSKGSSVVRWEIKAQDGKTLVTLTHTGVENFADAGADFSKENFEMGWKAIVKTNLRNYIYGIERLVFDIAVKTSPARLWHNLWDKTNYTLWTEPFSSGSYFEGELRSGARIHFLSPSGEGMYSDVTFFKENELVVFSHIGMLKDKKELPLDRETERWTGCFETYRLTPKGDLTLLNVQVDAIEGMAGYLKTTFPLALQRLKELAEAGQV